MLIAIQIAAVVILLTFYGWITYLIGTPKITEEYRAYYISRSISEWRSIRYHTALQQGFDFSREGYPDFVRFTEGISGHEAWGRWTDALLYPVARVIFDRKFFGAVCVALKAKPAGKQVGKEVSIRFGDQNFRFVTAEVAPKWYQFYFLLERPSDTLEIAVSETTRPRDWDASNPDSRKLGLGLYRLIVIPGECQTDCTK